MCQLTWWSHWCLPWGQLGSTNAKLCYIWANFVAKRVGWSLHMDSYEHFLYTTLFKRFKLIEKYPSYENISILKKLNWRYMKPNFNSINVGILYKCNNNLAIIQWNCILVEGSEFYRNQSKTLIVRSLALMSWRRIGSF